MHATFSAVVLALALACAARPALSQEARACANEVQRLSEGLPLVHAEGREGDALAQEPGARKGASLPDERRKQIEDLVRQAGAAGEQGDGQGCLKGLAEARALLREAGLGSGQPGSPTYDGAVRAGSTATSPGASAGSTGTQGAGDAGAVGGAAGADLTLPTGRGGEANGTTAGGNDGIGGAGGGAPGGSIAGGGGGGGSAGGSSGGTR